MINFQFEGLLQNLRIHETEIEAQSISFLNSNPKMKAFLQLIDRSLRTIHELNFNYETKIDDELTIQYLGCRIFNSATSALNLGVQGYYHPGLSISRDLVETGFLLDFFSIDPTQITAWKKADNKTRISEFSPFKIREKLDNRDEFKEGRRGQIYKTFCEYALHPSYQGFLFISQNGFVKIGPFYDEAKLRCIVEEIMMRLPIVVLYFIENFRNMPVELVEIKINFLKELNEIHSSYLGHNYGEKVKQLEELFEYAKENKML